MKKGILALAAAALMSLGFGNQANAQVEQGSIIIDPYYGYPNFGKSLASSLEGDFDEQSAVGGIGPAGLRFEYLLADNLGIGFDFIYNDFSVNGTIDSLNNDGTVYQSYDATAFARRIRFQARLNYHFVQTDVVDAYVGFGAGTNTRIFGFKTDYPNYELGDNVTGSLIPVSARIAVGTRYYFTPNIGLNAELGLGGPLVSAGLSIKF